VRRDAAQGFPQSAATLQALKLIRRKGEFDQPQGLCSGEDSSETARFGTQ
jgi:hypothetical protein